METYRIEFLRTALKELASLPQDVQERIKAKIDALQTDPRPPGVKVLKNGNGRLRLRVGDYRVIYCIEDDCLVVLVVNVGHRREIYRDLG